LRPPPGDNLCVEKNLSNSGSVAGGLVHDPFLPGAVVIVTLCNPREKFWGMILALAPAGLSLSGADLASFEDIAAMVREDEPLTPSVVFYPMHRIERVDLDRSDGSLSSLSHRFLAKTGLDPLVFLAPRTDGASDHSHHDAGPHAAKERA